jgi:hypothetical protein
VKKGSSRKRAEKEAAHVFPNDLERGDAGRHGHYFDLPLTETSGICSHPRIMGSTILQFDPLLQVVRVGDFVFAVRVR